MITLPYLSCVHASYFLRLAKILSPASSQLPTFESIAHLTAASLAAIARRAEPGSWQQTLIDDLLASRLALLANVYSESSDVHDPTIDAEPFFSLRLTELPALARRDPAMLKRWGVAQVASVFEHQLAFLVQSLGFYVASSRAGRSVVDLICVSSDPVTRFTFLLEAKSSRTAYKLPADDYRALVDYVADVRASLVSLPELRFVLLAAHEPGSTLATKLNRLQAQVGVPIRFCSALQLARLRGAISGVLQPRLLLRAVLESDIIVADDIVERIVAWDKEQRLATERLVRASLIEG